MEGNDSRAWDFLSWNPNPGYIPLIFVLLIAGNILMHESFIYHKPRYNWSYLSLHECTSRFCRFSIEAESFETFLSWITTDWIRCFRYGRVFLWCVDSLYFDLRFKLRIVNFTERLLSWETTSIVSVLYSVVPRNPFSWKIHRKN